MPETMAAGLLRAEHVGRFVEVVGCLLPLQLQIVAHDTRPPEGSPLAVQSRKQERFTWLQLRVPGREPENAWVSANFEVRLYDDAEVAEPGFPVVPSACGFEIGADRA